MRNHRYTTALLALCLAIASPAVLADGADDADGPDFGAIRAQQLELRQQVQAGEGPFADMNNVERKELASRQTRLLAVIEGKDALSDLDENEKVQAFNLLEEIFAKVNDAEDSRMVCERIRKTGSNRTVKECMTVAQRRRIRNDSETELRKHGLRGFVPLKN